MQKSGDRGVFSQRLHLCLRGVRHAAPGFGVFFRPNCLLFVVCWGPKSDGNTTNRSSKRNQRLVKASRKQLAMFLWQMRARFVFWGWRQSEEACAPSLLCRVVGPRQKPMAIAKRKIFGSPRLVFLFFKVPQRSTRQTLIVAKIFDHKNNFSFLFNKKTRHPQVAEEYK